MIEWGTDQERFARTNSREYRVSGLITFLTGAFTGALWGLLIGYTLRYLVSK
jgi:hypothetical protein